MPPVVPPPSAFPAASSPPSPFPPSSSPPPPALAPASSPPPPARLPWELEDPDEFAVGVDPESLGPSSARFGQSASPGLRATRAPSGSATIPGSASRFDDDLHPASGLADDLEPDLDPDVGPGARVGAERASRGSLRPSRVRVGVGAAVVLVIVALVCAVLVSMFSSRGRLDVVAPGASGASGPGGHPAASASVSPGPSDASAVPTSAAVTSGGSSAIPPSAGSSAAVPGGTPPTAGTLILLHVLGAVARPGLYELHAGDRVVDAVAAAGGFAPNADQTQQNLARPVADGEQLVIPEQGAAPPLGSAAAGTAGLTPAGSGTGSSGSSPGSSSGTAPGSAATAGHPAPLVNLNTADQTLLETLPQVGPALAQRIIAFRTTNGRFTQLEDLKNVPGIGDKTFAALQPLVTL